MIVYAVFLARADATGLLAAALVLLPAFVRPRGWHLLGRGARGVWVLGLTAVLAHGFGSPGDLVWPELGRWSPSREGLAEGLHQAGILMLLAVAARALVLTLPRAQLLGALVALLAPLRVLGLDPQRTGLRLALTLDQAQRLIAGGRRTEVAAGYAAIRQAPVPADAAPPPPVCLGGPLWALLPAPLGLAAVLAGLTAVLRAL